MKALYLVGIGLTLFSALAWANRPGRKRPGALLSPAEQADVDQRLRAFYAVPVVPGAMDQQVPKFDTRTGRSVDINPELRQAGPPPSDPLLRQAQAKRTRRYQDFQCNGFLKKHFPALHCDRASAWEAIQTDDLVADLAHTWMDTDDIVYTLDALPKSGRVTTTSYWSGDYWRTMWGLTSYRYSDGTSFDTYREAVDSYSQPEDWRGLLEDFDFDRIAKTVTDWSPSEKYDLTVGDTRFTLTRQQKEEGARWEEEEGGVAVWYGLCHGWAPASVLSPAPRRAVTATGPKGIKVTWYPDDVRAMETLAWANGSFQNNFIGGRCTAADPKRYRNGRLKAQECFDTNPATFHLSLGNLVGRKATPFIMDSAYDYEVWNQPILGYQFEYFSPLDSNRRSANWEEVSVPYDAAFKNADRFQAPLTRGELLDDGSFDDSGIDRVVGVIATVDYLSGIDAVHSPTASEPLEIQVTYTYDLELKHKGGRFIAIGGEWHDNAHPDFLWLPQKGSFPTGPGDEEPVEIHLDERPGTALSATARVGSESGSPLCAAVAALVKASSDGGTAFTCNPQSATP